MHARALRACCFTFAHGCTAACAAALCVCDCAALLTWHGQGMGLAPLESDPSADPPFSPFWTPFGAPPQEAQRAKVTLADNSTWEARLVGTLTALLFTD